MTTAPTIIGYRVYLHPEGITYFFYLKPPSTTTTNTISETEALTPEENYQTCSNKTLKKFISVFIFLLKLNIIKKY